MRVINNVAESVKDDLAATIEKGRKLSVTALSRERGMSGNIDLEKIVWENYDLVVIDESHNFRNGGEVYGENERDNRYNV
ncbi:MAG: hypothetical protein LBJ10_07585, partial [Clostridiales bacterium]|nr:hypothetical protein [Clostridiales bacterium]